MALINMSSAVWVWPDFAMQVIDEVKEETAHLLEQVKILSAKNDELRAEKEQADERIRQLTEQVDTQR